MRHLRIAVGLARLLAVLAAGVGVSLLLALLETMRMGDTWRRRQAASRWFLARLAGALPLRVHLHTEALRQPVLRQPVLRQPVLWVANHISWTDVALLGGLTPLTFLAKAEVRAWPLAGWLAARAGTLFIRRGAGEAGALNRLMAAHLRAGRSLCIFPEGTSSDGSGVLTFHGRLLAAAIEAGAVVQPVAIRYHRDGQTDLHDAPFVGDDHLLRHLIRLLGGARLEVDIHLLPPLASDGRTRNELARAAQAAIAAALQEALSDMPRAA